MSTSLRTLPFLVGETSARCSPPAASGEPANMHFLRQQLGVKSERRHVVLLPVKEAPVALVKPAERVGVLRHELAVQLS